jgi:hypothetical protein
MRPEHKVRLRLLGFSAEAVKYFERIYVYKDPRVDWGSEAQWEEYISGCEYDQAMLHGQLRHWNNTRNLG